MSEIYRDVPVQLSASERALRGEEMAREVDKHALLELQKKEETKRLGDLIKESDERIGKLARQVNTGIEMRPVRCVELLRPGRGLVELQRTDTGEIIDSRPMRADERQARMPFDEDDDESTKGSTH